MEGRPAIVSVLCNSGFTQALYNSVLRFCMTKLQDRLTGMQDRSTAAIVPASTIKHYSSAVYVTGLYKMVMSQV